MRFALLAMVAAFGLLLIARPVLAEKDEMKAKPTTTAVEPAKDTHAVEKKGGLSFLALERYDLGIFTLIVFGLLCLVLTVFAWPKISVGLADRKSVV